MIDRVCIVIERMRNTKVMRYLSDEVRLRIEEILFSEEFVEVFKKELNLELKDFSDEEMFELIDELTGLL